MISFAQNNVHDAELEAAEDRFTGMNWIFFSKMIGVRPSMLAGT